MDYPALLQQHFGFNTFRPGQLDVIEALATHNSALAVFPTGGGKSLCYQFPALTYDGVTIVISPLIALMKDQIDFLKRHGIAAARLDSSMSATEVRDVNEQLQNGTLKLLYVAPERFHNERFLGTLERTKISLFAIDEAHCISEWGHNFRPDYLKLADTAKALKVERVLALTATATPSVVKDICAAFDIPKEASILTGFYRQNLKLAITPVHVEDRDALLLSRLKMRKPGPTIVYVTLQKTAEYVAKALSDADIPARAYHAGMETEARTEVQEWWMASERNVVVATIAFGMGIDKSDVRYVYHYNLPKSLESYSQEIGRAGRDDQPSTVEMLACGDDVPTLENFVYGDTPSETTLQGLVKDLLSRGDEFDANLYEVSNSHDMRQLVLRTAMTYLELLGVLHQGTPFYAGYEIRPLMPVPEIVGKFKGEPAQFVEDIFASARRGKTWYALNPDTVAEQLGKERRRVVRSLEYLEEHGWVELRAADVRQRYQRLRPTEDGDALAHDLWERFDKREKGEVTRLKRVLSLITYNGCLTNALVGYFGQKRAEPCGHCSFCLTGKARVLPLPHDIGIPDEFDADAFRALRAQHPVALSDPRQAARFLAGLTSPATSRLKLSKNPMFGSLESVGFVHVLAFCQEG